MRDEAGLRYPYHTPIGSFWPSSKWSDRWESAAVILKDKSAWPTGSLVCWGEGTVGWVPIQDVCHCLNDKYSLFQSLWIQAALLDPRCPRSGGLFQGPMSPSSVIRSSPLLASAILEQKALFLKSHKASWNSFIYSFQVLRLLLAWQCGFPLPE